tara:strand:+ start:841 stop:1917 length:1077 start_codon:yes stop_codon:yes gene_type:complete
MYNLQDGTWRGQPKVMREKTQNSLAKRIRSHAIRHELTNVHLIMHGGEPLMMGKCKLAEWVLRMREILEPEIKPWFSIQSNGTLIDAEWIDLLIALRVGIGVSVDGPKEYHDIHRQYHSGKGSFEDVKAGIQCFQLHPNGHEVSGNVMAVVNTNIPPKTLFDFWMELGVDGFDLSLPHANYAHPPPIGAMGYGEWMVEFFDLWFDKNDPNLSVRYFENIIRMILGYPISTDNIGGKPVGVVVVETDGSIEPTDAFKCCEQGITKLHCNVHDDEFDALYGIEMVRVLQNGASTLCDQCQTCSIRDVCGGGYMPHRFSKKNQFDNPSVYCHDIARLVTHIRDRMVDVIPDEIVEKMQRDL